MLCPMVMYISTARKPTDSIRRRFSFGVSRSFSASSSAAKVPAERLSSSRAVSFGAAP